MIDLTSAAGIAAAAITLANVIVWAFGQGWTPRQKAGVGALSALGVFGLGVVLFPAAYQDASSAFVLLAEAVLVVLAAAGAPVYGEVMRKSASDAKRVRLDDLYVDLLDPDFKILRKRKWTGWNR